MNESLSSDAMSEADIDDLAARLDAIDVPDRMTLEAVDGFLCALIASPELVTPSVYLPVIFGGEEGLSAIFLLLSSKADTLVPRTSVAPAVNDAFALPLSQMEYENVDSMLEALETVNAGHQYFSLPNGITLMISVGEYDDLWWDRYISG